jgi:hypothetical protein
VFLPVPCGEEVKFGLQWTNIDEPVTGHLMADSAASKLAVANDEHADHAADAALAINILALNNTVMDLTLLTEALTKKTLDANSCTISWDSRRACRDPFK